MSVVTELEESFEETAKPEKRKGPLSDSTSDEENNGSTLV